MRHCETKHHLIDSSIFIKVLTHQRDFFSLHGEKGILVLVAANLSSGELLAVIASNGL